MFSGRPKDASAQDAYETKPIRRGNKHVIHQQPFEVTIITGIEPRCLSKSFTLDAAGELLDDSGGNLVRGKYERRRLKTLTEYWKLVGKELDYRNAVICGLPVAKEGRLVCEGGKLDERSTISRTLENFFYATGPALMAIDYDFGKYEIAARGAGIKQRAFECDELDDIFASVFPWWKDLASLMRSSASACIFREDDGSLVSKKGGLHVNFAVDRGDAMPDIARYMFRELVEAGYGYVPVHTTGKITLASVIDLAIYQPNRLIFESGGRYGSELEWRPINDMQDGGALRTEGLRLGKDEFETWKASSTAVRKLFAKAKPRMAETRAAYVDRRAAALVARGMSETKARASVESAVHEDILPREWEVSTPNGKVHTIGELLDNPKRFNGLLLCDPLEPDYDGGRQVAKAYLNGDCPTIFSQAHGGMTFHLLLENERDTWTHARTLKAAGGLGALMEKAEKAKRAGHDTARMGGSEKVDRTPDDYVADIALVTETDDLDAVRAAIKGIVLAVADRHATGNGFDPVAEERVCKAAKDQERFLGAGTTSVSAWKALLNSRKKAVIAARTAEEKEQRKAERKDSRPEIRCVPGELASRITQILDELADAKVDIYERAGELVRPYIYEQRNTLTGALEQTPALTPLTTSYLRDRAGEVLAFTRWSAEKDDYVDSDMTHDDAVIAMARVGEWPFRLITGIIGCPTLRPDGTVLRDVGYDNATGLHLDAPPKMDDIPEAPTRRQAEAALALLDSLLDEFPFVYDAEKGESKEDNPSRSVALSLLITPVVRGCMDTVPAFGITAFTPRTGKSTLMRSASYIAIGSATPAISLAPGRDGAAETEKRLAGALLTGMPLLNLDNANGEVGGDLFCQMVTEEKLAIRMFATLDLKTVPNRVTAIINGNNLQVAGDLASRTVLCSLDAKMERPEERTFKRDPIRDIKRNRGRYVAAALTVVMAYQADGSPDMGLPNMAGFDRWSKTVRSALVWLGCADPCKTMATVSAKDPEAARRLEVLHALKNAFGTGRAAGMRVADIASAISDARDPMKADDKRMVQLGEDLNAYMHCGGLSVQAFSKQLNRMPGRMTGGLVLRSVAPKGTAIWFVEDTKPGR